MTAERDAVDPLLQAYATILREVAGYNITEERLEAAIPLVRHMVQAIRMMDEVDVSEIEPMVAFKCLP
jgi:hypothetical protein